MNDILAVKEVVEKELHQFDDLMSNILKNDNSLLNEVIDFVFKKNGKQIRPILVFLSAYACGIPNKTTVSTAVALELLHTASLLHDDVVDESYQRRGQSSVNAIFDNKVAILAGDFFLASSLNLATETNSFQILRLFSSLGKDLSKGEIQQLILSKQNIINKNTYIEVIRQKTAALFAVCASSGALSVGAPNEEVDLLYKIGENLGIIFQIKDDIFDYFQNAELGKPTGNDMREGKVTLPLIYAIQMNDLPEYELIIKNIQENNFSEEDITKIVEFAKENGGIQYAEQVMEEYKNVALNLISQLKNNEIKNAFISLLNYFMVREK